MFDSTFRREYSSYCGDTKFSNRFLAPMATETTLELIELQVSKQLMNSNLNPARDSPERCDYAYAY